MHDPASWFRKTRFTRRRVRELKNAHNSVTVQNRTHVYINFFHHKDLGNHLLQLCPKVVKHPVYMSADCFRPKDTAFLIPGLSLWCSFGLRRESNCLPDCHARTNIAFLSLTQQKLSEGAAASPGLRKNRVKNSRKQNDVQTASR